MNKKKIMARLCADAIACYSDEAFEKAIQNLDLENTDPAGLWYLFNQTFKDIFGISYEDALLLKF